MVKFGKIKQNSKIDNVRVMGVYIPLNFYMFMPKVERSRGRESSSRGSRNKFLRRDNRELERDSGRNRRGSDRGSSRGSDRGSDRGYGREKPELQMTKVICSSCKSECEVPFKPTSSKPVYCRACFSQQGKGIPGSRPNSNSISSRDFDIINEKLNKIMKALNIE